MLRPTRDLQPAELEHFPLKISAEIAQKSAVFVEALLWFILLNGK